MNYMRETSLKDPIESMARKDIMYLRKGMGQTGLTYETLARKLGITLVTAFKRVKNPERLKATQLIELCKVLRLDLCQLMNKINEENPTDEV